jgi:hypothetical protein
MRYLLILISLILLSPGLLQAQYKQKSGINLGNIHSDGYVDMVKGALPFDKGSTDSPLSGAELDIDGWPLRDFRLLLMDNRPVAEWADAIDDPEEYRVDFSGTYQGSFKGEAEIFNIGGPWSLENQVYDAPSNTTAFDLVIGAPGDNHGLVIMNFVNTKKTAASATNTGISDLRIIRPGYEGREDQHFADHLIDLLLDMNFAAIRSQNFTGTTSWDIQYPEEYHWDQRKLPEDIIQSQPFMGKRERAAWEHFIDLCNAANADIWINVPISASDDYVTSLAQLLAIRLDESLNIYVENDNEIWNSAPAFIGTYQYNLAEANDLGITEQENIARRAVELAGLFAGVFGQNEINNRVRVVLASHAPMVKWWVTPMLNYINITFGPPKNYIYAISRQTYFSAENADNTSMKLSVDELINECYENIEGQTGTDVVNESSREDWIRVASEWELPGGANSYEGGPHTPAGGSLHNLDNQIKMHRSQRMIRLVRYNIVNSWFDLGGELAMYFTLYSSYSRYGCWGLTDDLHHPDRNYKMEAMRNLETVTSLRDEWNEEEEIILYPNPGNDQIKIKSQQYQNFRVEILDLQGRRLYQDDHYVSDSLIPVNYCKNGIYLVKITSSQGVVTKKIRIE